ncbi:hypothetical protein [Salmonella sp. 32070601201500089SM]|uniref:hypothetical protein n=1 Tax=Salmonella sp. 32070601201500089SM TaxID=2819686 RepID=UPI0013258341|nr:hypothetical protein [Salmonella sp. 32070601201500089SM]ECW3355659.1 hypothetical protein [Salmonella enterica subsp. enterica serovar Lagos]MBO2431521.1 hypothetical protein [Salmonella sp. 32070601201500089SM]
MLHLMYLLKPTHKAHQDMPAFWHWVEKRDEWFYRTLEMAGERRWYVRTIGNNVHCLEHYVTFADESAWGQYRRAVSALSQIPEWEKIRSEQELWWDILDSSLLNDAPFISSGR